MGGGFHVDMGALERASDGVTETLALLARKKVEDIDPSKSAFGHDRLAGSVEEFCARWQIGVGHLAKDGEEIASRLAASVKAYLSVDKSLQGHFDGALDRESGPDPAAG
jgi:hypothetical protein